MTPEDKIIKGQLCTICGKPDEFSNETICSKCIQSWKEKIIQKSRNDCIRSEINFLTIISESSVTLKNECKFTYGEIRKRIDKLKESLEKTE